MVADDLWTQAHAILDATLAALTTQPKQAYVADGAPAFDLCEQLTVYIAGMRLGTPPTTRPDYVCGPTSVIAVVTRTWCVPVGDGDPPRLGDMIASGKTVVNGAQEFVAAVRAAASTVTCKPSIETIAPIGPLGGMIAWTVTMSWIP